MHEALWIEHVYKRRYGEWQQDMEAGSAKALIMLACLVWRRDGRDADAAWRDIMAGDLDFDLAEMLDSMAKAAEDAEKAAAAEGPTTPGTPRDQDGSLTIAKDMPGSSASISTSPRGKSASSRSKTSRPS
ncbi:MAG TPA: hypothetical protein VFQ68_44580 [Streptosporangiaceae bacterium]|nr:hypothetical protein [Streptosporangiaceae bacterium]